MGRKREEKSVIYVGEGDGYERQFRNGTKVVLKKGVVTPVSNEIFHILNDVRNVYEVVGQTYDTVSKKDFKEKTIKE